MKHYGERIAYLREKHKMKQEELAAKLGISRASLSHYEKQRRQPDYKTLKKIADYFDVTIDYIIGRTDNPGTTVDPETKQFVESLELSDERILEKFALTVDGRELSPEEAKRFIAFVRAERAMENKTE